MTELGADEVSMVSGGNAILKFLEYVGVAETAGNLAAALNGSVWRSQTYPGNVMHTDPSSKYAQNGHDKQDNDFINSGGGAGTLDSSSVFGFWTPYSVPFGSSPKAPGNSHSDIW